MPFPATALRLGPSVKRNAQGIATGPQIRAVHNELMGDTLVLVLLLLLPILLPLLVLRLLFLMLPLLLVLVLLLLLLSSCVGSVLGYFCWGRESPISSSNYFCPVAKTKFYQAHFCCLVVLGHWAAKMCLIKITRQKS